MSDLLIITNRSLCQEDFLCRIEKLAKAHPKGIILREKDLSGTAYKALAEKVLGICRQHGTPCILHSFVRVARGFDTKALHLPLPLLRSLSIQERSHFTVLGASCHSIDDAKEAEALGCTYITAGHVFDTDCKKGLPGRGLTFLKEMCENVHIPVYAIGGITADNSTVVRKTGAAGVCVMSGAMTCNDVSSYLATLL